MERRINTKNHFIDETSDKDDQREKKTLSGLKEFFRNKTHNLTIAALIIAMTVVFARFLAIQTPIVRISLEFIPIVLGSVILGPVVGGICAALADLTGAIAFPAGPFFPGFTFSAAVYGLIYGLFLYGRKITVKNTLICVLVNIFIVDFVLVSIWVHILMQLPYSALIITRTIKCAIMYPIQVITIYYGVNAILRNVRVINNE